MKVHRIITTIEVENDNSITSIELTKLYPASDCILLAITNLTTNGNANDINKVHAVVDKLRIVINGELKSIARIINDSLDDYECGIIGRDYNDSECNDKTSYVSELTTTHLVKQDDVGMTVVTGIDTALTQSGVRGESPIEPDGTSKTS